MKQQCMIANCPDEATTYFWAPDKRLVHVCQGHFDRHNKPAPKPVEDWTLADAMDYQYPCQIMPDGTRVWREE